MGVTLSDPFLFFLVECDIDEFLFFTFFSLLCFGDDLSSSYILTTFDFCLDKFDDSEIMGDYTWGVLFVLDPVFSGRLDSSAKLIPIF